MNTSHDSSPSQPKVCLVTGGAGMLGRAIVSQLLDKGASVRILDIEKAQNDRAEVMVGDVRDEAAVRKACEGVDTVFHVAAAVWDPGLPRDIYESTNVTGTKIIIDTCLQMGIPRLVYTSTLDVVLDGVHAHCMADESAPYPSHPEKMNRYAWSKMIGEQAIIAANGPALSTCSLRVTGMYGPGDRYHLPNIVKNARHGVNIRLGDGKACFSHLFAGNAAHAHILAAEQLYPGSPAAGQFYFITDHDTGNFFIFMNPFLEALGIPKPKIAVPYRLAYALAWIIEKFSPKSNLNRFSVFCTCVDATFVHDKATRDFGYEPIFSADEAFNITLDWLKEQDF